MPNRIASFRIQGFRSLADVDVADVPMATVLIGTNCSGKSNLVIVATLSPLLVDNFGLDEIVVLEMEEGRTKVRRFDGAQYGRWLEDYSTGELWQKNVLGGRP